MILIIIDNDYNHKASQYGELTLVASFRNTTIDKWERSFSRIPKCVDITLQVGGIEHGTRRDSIQ